MRFCREEKVNEQTDNNADAADTEKIVTKYGLDADEILPEGESK